MAGVAPFAGSSNIPGVQGGKRYSTRYWEAVTADLEQQNRQMIKSNPNRQTGNWKPVDKKLLQQ